MKKVELLAPAGDYDCLVSAVNNGADAVYISGQDYGARKFAKNFTLEEIEKAIKYSHLYGVKVYITINTVIYEDEVNDFISYVDKIHQLGVDAVIMQDIGMIDLVYQTFPNLEIHASTQVHNHNIEGITFLEKLGVKRIVLDRELNLSQINKIDTSLEKEVFIHGALCVSYSGECLFSSVKLNRSGNKGECAGLCRLPYDLYKDDELINTKGKYLLSMKELNTTNYLRDILSSNISSLKIEGRMKSKEYVGFVTRLYRKLIDNFYNNEEMIVTKDEEKKLKLLYNREFTKGFINDEDKDLIVNSKTPNHQGIIIGEVVDIDKKIKIKLFDNLNQGDGIRFSNNEGMIANFIYNEKDLLINSASKDSIIYLDNKVDLKEKGSVLKTFDIKLMEEINNYESKKININIECNIKLNSNIVLKVSDGENELLECGITVDKALNKPTTKEEILEKLTKLGNTPFITKNVTLDMDDNVFVPLKEINHMRQTVIEKLILLRENKKNPYKKNNYIFKNISQEKTNNYSFLVRTEEQIQYLLDKDVLIYVDNFVLFNKYKLNENVIFRTSRVINDIPEINDNRIVASDLGIINKYGDRDIIGDIYLNVDNSYSATLFAGAGVKTIGLSIELKNNDIEKILKTNYNINYELLIYGTTELMLMKYCVISSNILHDKCGLCGKNNYYLLSNTKEKYPLITNNCLVKLLNKEKVNNISKIDYYKSMGITNFRFDLYDEDIDDLKNILDLIKK